MWSVQATTLANLMGMQTHISILNDHFDWIQKNPKKFVSAIASGMNSGTESLSRGGRWGPDQFRDEDEREAVMHYVTVHQAHHMDTPFTLVAHQNSSYDIWDLITALNNGFLAEQENPEVWEGIIKGVLTNLKSSTKNLEKALKKATE